MIKHRHVLIISALFAACTFALSSAASAQTIIKLGWTTADGATDPYAIGARDFKAAVEKNTNGSV